MSPMQRFSVSMDPELYATLLASSQRNERSIAAQVRLIVKLHYQGPSDKLIMAAINWRETDGRTLSLGPASGRLNVAVAEYLQQQK